MRASLQRLGHVTGAAVLALEDNTDVSIGASSPDIRGLHCDGVRLERRVGCRRLQLHHRVWLASLPFNPVIQSTEKA